MSSDEYRFGYSDNEYNQENIIADLRAKLEAEQKEVLEGYKDYQDKLDTAKNKNKRLSILINKQQRTNESIMIKLVQTEQERDNLQARLGGDTKLLEKCINDQKETIIGCQKAYDNLQAANGVLREALNKIRNNRKSWKSGGIGGQDKYAGQPPTLRVIDETLSITQEQAGERVQGLVTALEGIQSRIEQTCVKGSDMGDYYEAIDFVYSTSIVSLAKYRGCK